MQPVELHYATDRRCYWGAPSSDLDKEWKSIEQAREQLKAHGLRATYFPAGGFYVGFRVHEDKAPEILTHDCKTFEECYRALCAKCTP